MIALDILITAVVLYTLVDIRKIVKQDRQPKFGKSVVMDTSTLIDGRILDVVKSGFLQQKIIVPKIVLRELQLLADGRDAHKRERARLGLDVVTELQQLKTTNVEIDDYGFSKSQLTDDLILQLAVKRNASLCTTDFNLNKVAVVEGVSVLNVNELAQVLRPKMLPGETVEVKIIQKGESASQGVGYLDDGTMVVVDGAGRLKNKTVHAKVERMIQTKAGKMIFAILV
jgi:uncharacterized protein YacL